MTYNDTIRRIWSENILYAALVELTYRCNLNCSFCYNDTALKGIPLTTAQYFDFFQDLYDLGTLNLTLTGGEPLAHPEFFALGRRARELGFVVRVKSNAHALRGKLAQRMRDEVDPFMVEVSLHGASAETHDRQTQVPGSFSRLTANLRESRALGLRIKLNSPLTLWNEREVEAMYALADDLGIPIQFDPLITRRDNGDAEPQRISPSREGIARLHQHQRERDATRRARRGAAVTESAVVFEPSATVNPLKEVEAPRGVEPSTGGREKHCGAGSSSITIDPFGNVYPCVQWRRRIGNLHEDSIRTLWNHSDELAEIRRLSTEVKEAVDRHQAPGLGFCPGSAEQETGSPMQLYPGIQIMRDLRTKDRTG